MSQSEPSHEAWEKSAPADREEAGPFDEAEANAARPYVDLGGLKVLPREGLDLRLEVDEKNSRVVALALDYAESSLQVQAFAAPRSSGLWHEILPQLTEQVKKQGGRIEQIDGSLGAELVAEVPVAATESAAAHTRRVRFVGVDGPRWFLRGVISGRATQDADAAALIEDLYRSLVVVRGNSPMPPRDLIPLRMPPMPKSAKS